MTPYYQDDAVTPTPGDQSVTQTIGTFSGMPSVMEVVELLVRQGRVAEARAIAAAAGVTTANHAEP